MPPWTVAALAVAFACADRLAGADLIHHWQVWTARQVAAWPPWLGRTVITVIDLRSTFWGGAALALMLAIVGRATVYGPRLAVLAIGFAAWRWDGWTAFGGDMDPKTSAQRWGLFWRHLLAVPAFLPALAGFERLALLPTLGALVALIMFAVYATALGGVLAAKERPGVDINAFIELARGFGLGAIVAVTLI